MRPGETLQKDVGCCKGNEGNKQRPGYTAWIAWMLRNISFVSGSSAICAPDSFLSFADILSCVLCFADGRASAT